MRCPPILDLQSYVDGELGPGQAEPIGKHLILCRECRERAKALHATASLLHILAAPPVMAAVNPAPAAWRKTGIPVRLRWLAVPVAACLTFAAIAAWRHVPLNGRNKDFIAAFVEAHETDGNEQTFPASCDFGLGGPWQ